MRACRAGTPAARMDCLSHASPLGKKHDASAAPSARGTTIRVNSSVLLPPPGGAEMLEALQGDRVEGRLDNVGALCGHLGG